MIRVTRLPKDPGPSGWNGILATAPDRAPLTDGVTADWLVIGAGFTGLAATRRLQQLNTSARIVIVDATNVGEGPAGRNSGFMIDVPHDLSSDSYSGRLDADKTQIELNRHGIDFAQSMAGEFGLSDEAFSRSGKINGAGSASGMDNNTGFARPLDALGEPYEVLDANQMRNITGTDYYLGGLFAPGSAMIQPALFVRGIAKGLRGLGVELFENTPVVALEKSADWIAKTPHGQITARNVILAVNGHANSFGLFDRRFVHVFTYASMTRALSDAEIAKLGGRANWGITPADPMGTTVRRITGLGGARIVVRNRFTYDPTLEVPDNRVRKIARNHDSAFQSRFPGLSDVVMEYRWGGRLCLSRNQVQVVRQIDDGLFAACCQNGLGTVKGTLAGKLVAELATGNASRELDLITAMDQPQKLPPEPFASVGARAAIRWKEWRARQEF